MSKLWETVKGRAAWRAAVHGFAEQDTTERLNGSLFFCHVVSLRGAVPEHPCGSPGLGSPCSGPGGSHPQEPMESRACHSPPSRSPRVAAPAPLTFRSAGENADGGPFDTWGAVLGLSLAGDLGRNQPHPPELILKGAGLPFLPRRILLPGHVGPPPLQHHSWGHWREMAKPPHALQTPLTEHLSARLPSLSMWSEKQVALSSP